MLKDIIKQAEDALVDKRNHLKGIGSEVITTMIKNSNGKLPTIIVLRYLLECDLYQLNDIYHSIKNSDITFMEACNKVGL